MKKQSTKTKDEKLKVKKVIELEIGEYEEPPFESGLTRCSYCDAIIIGCPRITSINLDNKTKYSSSRQFCNYCCWMMWIHHLEDNIEKLPEEYNDLF